MFRQFACRCAWFVLVVSIFAGTFSMPTARAQDNERLALFAIDLEKGNTRLLTTEPLEGYSNCGASAWSPDGKRFVFDATPGRVWNKTHMFVAEFPKAGDAKFTDLGQGNCPSWSPDAKRIVFLLNPGPGSDAEAGIWIMTADAAFRRRVGGSGRPKWSPDGKQILVASFANPSRLSLIDLATEEELAINLPRSAFLSVPSWAGDSQTIVSVVQGDGPISIALVDVSTPAEAKIKQVLWTLGDGLDAMTCPVYSPKLKRCVFAGWKAGGTALYVLDADHRAPRRLEGELIDQILAGLALSSDGRHLLFVSNRNPVDSGK
jgi:Tol biopolymer transport system component